MLQRLTAAFANICQRSQPRRVDGRPCITHLQSLLQRVNSLLDHVNDEAFHHTQIHVVEMSLQRLTFMRCWVRPKDLALVDELIKKQRINLDVWLNRLCRLLADPQRYVEERTVELLSRRRILTIQITELEEVVFPPPTQLDLTTVQQHHNADYHRRQIHRSENHIVALAQDGALLPRSLAGRATQLEGEKLAAWTVPLLQLETQSDR